MKSSDVLLIIALVTILFSAYRSFFGGGESLTTEIIILIAAFHVCKTIEDKDLK